MSADLKVFTGGGQNVQTVSGELAEKIKTLIYEYGGKLPLSSAIGVLDIIKFEIIQEHK